MKPVKRVEIVVEAVHEQAVERLIRRAGIDGYTLIRDVAGLGGRGERAADGLTSAFQNVCFIVAAPPDDAMRLAESLRNLLRQSGGMVLITDAMWLGH